MAATPEENLTLISSRLAELPSLRALRALPAEDPESEAELPPHEAEAPAVRAGMASEPPLAAVAERDPARFVEAQTLERRSREWTILARQLEQHRLQLAAIEREQDSLHEQLTRLMPVAQASYRALKGALAARKEGHTAANLADLAAANVRGMEDVERVVGALDSQALWFRSTWEQYAQTVRQAERLRTRIESEISG